MRMNSVDTGQGRTNNLGLPLSSHSSDPPRKEKNTDAAAWRGFDSGYIKTNSAKFVEILKILHLLCEDFT